MCLDQSADFFFTFGMILLILKKSMFDVAWNDNFYAEYESRKDAFER